MSLNRFAYALLCAGCIASLSTPALASPYEVGIQGQPREENARDDILSRFAPRTSDTERQIDYSVWGVALRSMVVGFGPSLREGARRPENFTGSRILRGHTSRLRMEGSRIAYFFFNDDVRASLSEYRQDLERVGSELDIPSLSRNEQLAFWLNLHNVAVIEQIALNYPTIVPGQIEIDGVPLDEARFIEVAGVMLSPRDIRTRIVYPNWNDPRVIYGFFRGDIGSPLIQPEEFNARNLDFLLADNAHEFVNSLRGTERRGSTLHVSTLYEEAAPFYFRDFEADLRAHLAGFAEEEVSEDIARAQVLEASIYEDDIADLARGQKQSPILNLRMETRDGRVFFGESRTPLNIQRYMAERGEKIAKLERRGERLWTIRVIPLDLPGEPSSVPEIE